MRSFERVLKPFDEEDESKSQVANRELGQLNGNHHFGYIISEPEFLRRGKALHAQAIHPKIQVSEASIPPSQSVSNIQLLYRI